MRNLVLTCVARYVHWSLGMNAAAKLHQLTATREAAARRYRTARKAWGRAHDKPFDTETKAELQAADDALYAANEAEEAHIATMETGPRLPDFFVDGAAS